VGRDYTQGFEAATVIVCINDVVDVSMGSNSPPVRTHRAYPARRGRGELLYGPREPRYCRI